MQDKYSRHPLKGLETMNKIPKSPRHLLEEITKDRPEIPKQVESIPPPKLPTGELSTGDQWRSLLWSIDTAESLGSNALSGLTQALARIVQAEILQGLLFDARENQREPNNCPESLLWDPTVSIRSDGSTMNDLLSRETGQMSLDLAHSAVIPETRLTGRLARAFQNLGPTGKDGVWHQTSNTHVVAWKPWPLAWISNGNHTAMAAIVTHGGTLKASEIYDAMDLLLCIYTDGENWIRVDNRESIEPVRSMAMAGIFEIGRRLVGAPKLV
jgi:hypothetical protein